MSQFMQLFKNQSPGSTPSSPNSTKREGRFRKFRRNGNRSSVIESDSVTNLSKKKSFSMSALVQPNTSPSDEMPKDWANKNRKRNSTISMVPKSVNYYEETELTVSEPQKKISVKELVENMILHLQLLERQNENLSQKNQQLNDQKTTLETELSSTKVELNLYKNRLNQIEKLCDEWHCSLCADNKIQIINTKRIIVSLFCGHLFCSSCAHNLNSSIRQSKQCPTCRKPLKEGQLNYHPIYV